MAESNSRTLAALMSKPRSVLIVLSTGHVALRELRPVVEHFHANGWRVVLRLGASGREASDAAAMFRGRGMDAEIIPPGIGYGEAEQGEGRPEADAVGGALPPAAALGPSRAREAVKRVLRPFLVHRAVAFWRYYRAALRRRRWATALLQDKSVDAVLMNMFHSVGEVDNALQWAARRARLPLLCLTNAPYVGEAINIVSRTNHLQTGMSGPEIRADYDPLNRLMAALVPDWTRVLPSGVRVFNWDPVRIVAGKLAQLGMNRMWTKPSLDFDQVFVFSEFSRQLLLDCKYPDHRIQVAGQPLLDQVLRDRSNEVRQDAIAAHIGVSRGEGYILVNIEPSVEHNYASAEAHWCNFDIVVRACSGHGRKVVLSLHPLCNIPEYLWVEAKYGYRISRDYPIHELYPNCLVSVSFPCSTNVLALRFRKPLIIYDLHHNLGRDDLTDKLYRLPGALVAWNEEQLRSHISTALCGPPSSDGDYLPENASAKIVESVSAAVDGAAGAPYVARP